MADAVHIPDEAETRARWGAFAWNDENAEKAKIVLGRYPAGREQSASIPLLDLAQRQVGAETHTQGWLPVPVTIRPCTARPVELTFSPAAPLNPPSGCCAASR